MKILLVAGLLLTINFTNAQVTSCEVKPDALKGKYEGDCVKGKAHGLGIATGIDNYEGAFKNGYPDGIGRYNWKNGNYYFGSWKKGVREGKGEMHVMVEGRDSMVVGYWKKDKFSGEYEHPYVIVNTTQNIGRVEINNMKDGQQKIMINASSLYSGTGFGGVAKMTDLQVLRGTYMSKSSNTLTNKDVTILQGVIFPFRARFSFTGTVATMIEIEFFEEGNWEVTVPIDR